MPMQSKAFHWLVLQTHLLHVQMLVHEAFCAEAFEAVMYLFKALQSDASLVKIIWFYYFKNIYNRKTQLKV